MKKPDKLVKFTSGATAVLFGLGVAMPALFATSSAWAAQIQSRSIQMGSAQPGVTTSYKVTFTPQTSEASGVVYIDFCSNSPLEGDVCDSAATDVPDTTNVTGPATTTSVGANHHTVKLAGQTLTSGTQYQVTLANIKNPTATNFFYARIFTGATGYTYTPAADGATPTDTGYVDFGGAALSTANVIGITARVQESLQFCVLNVAPTDACANANGSDLPNITLGHGPNMTLDGSAVDTAQVYSQLSTNANNGAVVQAHINNACGGLSSDGGTSCPIAAVNSGGATPAKIDTGNSGGAAVFGMLTTEGTSTTGTILPDGNYNDGTNTTCDGTGHYGWDTTSGSGQNVTGTFGDEVAHSTGPLSNANSNYCFAATAVPTTPAGVYTAEVSLIATGTF